MKKKAAMVLAIIIFIVSVYFLIGRPILKLVDSPEKLKLYLDEKGPLGYLVFILFVVIQTMSTCIPGTPFYLASGYVLGGVRAALLCDFAATTGNTIAFLIGRKYGRSFLEKLFSEASIRKVEKYTEIGNPKLVHVLFMLLPLPKDTYAWFGYYSKENLLMWIIITYLARFPHIFVYAFGGNQLGSQNYLVLVIAATFAVILYIFIMIWLRKKKHKNK